MNAHRDLSRARNFNPLDTLEPVHVQGKQLITSDGRPSPLVYREEVALPDNRPEWERLRELVQRHRANQKALTAIVEQATTLVDCPAFARAEDACEASYSDLAVAIEDAFCVSAAELAKALS